MSEGWSSPPRTLEMLTANLVASRDDVVPGKVVFQLGPFAGTVLGHTYLPPHWTPRGVARLAGYNGA